jgi:hypothetical protein
MNLLWRDSFGSFLDPSVPDGNGGATPLASWDTGPLSGQSLLWTGNGLSPSAASDVNTAHLAGFDAGTTSLPSTGSGLSGQDVLWADSGASGTTWQLADNAGDTGAMGLATPSLPLSAGSMPSDVGSLVWQATLFRFEEVSALANSSTLDSALNQILDIVWTATGGTGSPPVTLPDAPTNPFVDGSPLVFLSPSQLVWTGGSGQPPGVTPPITGTSQPVNLVDSSSSQGWTFPTLASQPLVWTELVNGVATPLSDPTHAATLPVNPLFTRA